MVRSFLTASDVITKDFLLKNKQQLHEKAGEAISIIFC